MKIFSLLELKYNAFVNSVRKYLADTLPASKNPIGSNTVFGQFINVLNGAIQNIMLYIEDSMTEQNKYTAQRKKSIYGLAAQSGYNPSLGYAAKVQLKMNYVPTNTQNLNVFINNHEQLTCTQNGLVYNIVLPQESILMSIDVDNNPKYFTAVQGRFEEQTFVATGGKYYTQNFDFLGNMDVQYLEVYVNDEKWELTKCFYDMGADGKQYTYKISPIKGVDLVFGNDKFGRSLKSGDVVRVSYLVHDGELGNINVNEETYFIFNNSLQDISGHEVDGNNTFNITFASQDAVTSGSNAEQLSQVRQMIGLNSRSLVLASADNYKELISKFSFCGYNRTWSEAGSLIVNSLIMKNYKLQMNDGKDYFNLTENDFRLSDSQKVSLTNFIKNTGSQLAGVTYNIFDPVLCKYAMYIYIKPKNVNYDKNSITTNIRNLVGEFFSNIQSDIFIPKSDIISLIKENVADVDGVDVYIMSEQNETAKQVGYYDKKEYLYNPSTNSYNVKTSRVSLYDGEDPNLGLDSHGNIYLDNNENVPVLMGGWDFVSTNDLEDQQITINDPLIIIFE